MKNDADKNHGNNNGQNDDNIFEGNEKYKYHQSQKKADKDHKEDYGDKPKNHTSPQERMLNPDRGED
ncbi:hypothetical protein [Flavobacterium sp. MK4S-17]|uniref:hypothetical protein n=1 Tax=Flavobacterium sp. MK4S-17 TaxID=2543737 RepID=UPI00135829EF|nr:hypothetical protein [Flavobacterium sp. MK4S-17]